MDSPNPGSQESEENQSEEAANVDVVQQGPPGPQAIPEPEPEPEVEKTLTDHLNKKLLQSFMQRLESGNMQFPQGVQEPMEEEGEFEDEG